MSIVAQADIALLQEVSLFKELDDFALEQIYLAAKRRKVSADTVLFRQDDPARVLYVVIEGRVRVSETTAEGHEVLLRFIEPGQQLGLMAALEDMNYPVTAEVSIDSRILSWTNKTINNLLDSHPKMARNSMRLMVSRIKELQQRCVELSTERVEQRVARALVRLVTQTGKRTDEGILLDMELSRQDIGAMTGTTLFTVSRLLNRWQDEKIVKIGRQKVIIQKPHEMVALADALPK